ncbi:hypothetical protein BDF19DRAFT_420626 [Syncephalis fuscata]|nr:hypothetical protein BDF19DRAFT_420626 [Syncephalis fuscata]
MTWKKLTIPSPSVLFGQIFSFNSVRKAGGFVVADVDINADYYVEPVEPGDKIVTMVEMEETYIKKETRSFNASGGYTSTSSAIRPLAQRLTGLHQAIIVWPTAGNSPPSIIYLKDPNSHAMFSAPRLIDIYDNWMFLQAYAIQGSCQGFYLLDLMGNDGQTL